MSETVTMDISTRLLTTEEAGIFLHASAWTVRDLIRSGALEYVPRGRKKMLDLKDLENYIDRMKVRDEN